jgi:WD40 repeat protein
VWEARTGAEVLSLNKGHTHWVTSAAFSPDGSRILTASQDGTAKLWDARTGSEVLSLKANTEPLNSAAFSPDGSRVVAASHDGTARIWDARPFSPDKTVQRKPAKDQNTSAGQPPAFVIIPSFRGARPSPTG